MSERALATVAQIEHLTDIEDADLIVTARIRGWDVVVKRDEFAAGDTVIYFEVDSFLPIDDGRFAFLAPRGVRIQEDIPGHVLKTARLRGQYSQGLALPFADFPEVAGAAIGDDVTDALGITKWDPPLPAELAGMARGVFPSSFRKTDEERIQNMPDMLDAPGAWVATEKIDGTSMTVALIDGEEHVSTRNYDLQDTPGHSMWTQARALGLFEKMHQTFPGRDVAVQGELFGPGIQGNPLHVKHVQFAMFTLQADGRIIARDAWPAWAREISVPVHDVPFPATMDEAIAVADKRASLIPGAQGNIEGLVFTRTDVGEVRGVKQSFKSISRAYLAKHDR